VPIVLEILILTLVHQEPIASNVPTTVSVAREFASAQLGSRVQRARSCNAPGGLKNVLVRESAPTACVNATEDGQEFDVITQLVLPRPPIPNAAVTACASTVCASVALASTV